jgi:hypothetical protein
MRRRVGRIVGRHTWGWSGLGIVAATVWLTFRVGYNRETTPRWHGLAVWFPKSQLDKLSIDNVDVDYTEGSPASRRFIFDRRYLGGKVVVAGLLSPYECYWDLLRRHPAGAQLISIKPVIGVNAKSAEGRFYIVDTPPTAAGAENALYCSTDLKPDEPSFARRALSLWNVALDVEAVPKEKAVVAGMTALSLKPTFKLNEARELETTGYGGSPLAGDLVIGPGDQIWAEWTSAPAADGKEILLVLIVTLYGLGASTALEWARPFLTSRPVKNWSVGSVFPRPGGFRGCSHRPSALVLR